jgi:hypothetical protein
LNSKHRPDLRLLLGSVTPGCHGGLKPDAPDTTDEIDALLTSVRPTLVPLVVHVFVRRTIS